MIINAMMTTVSMTTMTIIVKRQVDIPRWFTENTQLCYDWYPDGNGGQCSGPSRHLCAKPGLMTAEYRDDSDGRSGGCRMSWSLSASHHEDWFNQVQVCFCLSVSPCLSVRPCHTVCLSVCLSVRVTLSDCPCHPVCTCHPVCVTVCLPVCPCHPACLPVCLSVSP